MSVDWDDVSGASYYWVRWRESGSGNELSEGVVVLPSEAVIAVSGYGEWVVRAQACNNAGCGAPAVSKFSVDEAPVISGQPDNLEVISEPGSKALLATWDAVEGATSYKLRWRRDGGEFETDNAATVSDAMWVVTVSDYGRWEVRVQGCNDDGCGPEAAATAEAVRAASLSLERAVDSQGNVLPRTLTANWDPVEGASSYTLSWQRLGDDSQANTQSQAQSASDARQSRSASVVSGKSADTRTANQLTFSAEETSTDLTVPDDGAYRVDLKALNDGGESIALASSHINQAPGQPDTTPPWLVGGEMDGNRVRLYFSEPLNETATGGRLRPTVQYDDCCTRTGIVEASLAVSGNEVTADFGGYRRAVEGLRAFVAYWVYPGDTSLRDLVGNKVWTPHVSNYGAKYTPTVALRNVTGRPKIVPLTPGGLFGPSGVVISSDAGDDRFYTAGDTITVRLTFSESVDVTGTPRLKIDLDPAAGAGEKWADYSAGSGTTMLEFAYTTASADLSTAGVAASPNTLELNGGTIRAAWARGVEEARLGHPGLGHNPSHRVVTPDSAAPILQNATVTGTDLTLTFSESLGAAASLANGAFTLKKTPQGGTEQTVSLSGSPAISGSTVTLTLSSAVLATDAGVKVSYAKPTTGTNNRLVDAGGAEAADFTDEPVVTNTLDTTKPELLRGEIKSTGGMNVELTLYFSEQMDEHSWGAADYYRVHLRWMPVRGGYAYTIEPRKVTVSGNKVVVNFAPPHTLQRPIRDQVVEMYYITDRNSSAGRLRDHSGNAVSTPLDLFREGYDWERGWWSTKTISLTNLTQ